MTLKARKERQKKLAHLFLEMGMDEDLVSKISGLSINEINNFNIDTNNKSQYNSIRKIKNDSYLEPRDRGNR